MQSALWESALEELVTHATKMMAFQNLLVAKSTELSQSSALNVEMSNEPNRGKLQIAAGDTLSDDLRSVAGACKRPAKRAKMTRQCKCLSSIPSTLVFSTRLEEKDDLKNCCEALTLENQYIPRLATEVMNLREKMAARK